MQLIERNGIYYISYYDKRSKRQRRVTTGIPVGKDKRRFAMAKLREMEKMDESAFYNSLPSGKAKLFSEAYKKYMELSADFSPSTRALKKLASDQFIEICGDRFIHDYKLEDFESFRNKLLKNGKSVNTVNIRTKDIRAIFNFFVNHEWLEKNYAVVQRPHYKKPKSIPLSDWEEIYRASSQRSLKFARLIKFMLLTGLRSGEAVALTWDRVLLDQDPPVLLMYNKNLKDEEYCLLLPEAAGLLKLMLETKGVYPRDSVFGFESRRLITFERVQVKLWGEARYSLHNLRKTYITYLFELGLDITEVRVLSRHGVKSMEILAEHYRDVQNKKLVDKVAGREKSFLNLKKVL